jgi:hypothetical protein
MEVEGKARNRLAIPVAEEITIVQTYRALKSLLRIISLCPVDRAETHKMAAATTPLVVRKLSA